MRGKEKAQFAGVIFSLQLALRILFHARSYRYDVRAGFWGPMGMPATGIILVSIVCSYCGSRLGTVRMVVHARCYKFMQGYFAPQWYPLVIL